jgi:hypothetical protein
LLLPVSERAIEAIMSDGVAARRHSATGTVDLVVVDHRRAVPDRCLLSAGIPEHLLPAVDWRVRSGTYLMPNPIKIPSSHGRYLRDGSLEAL